MPWSLADIASVIKAKRAVEAMVETGEAVVHVPTVEDVVVLAADLGAAGVAAKQFAGAPVDVKAIRAGVGLTQEQFALRFGLDVDAVQNWEQGRCQPDRATASYLRAIAKRPREAPRRRRKRWRKRSSSRIEAALL